MKKYVNLKKIEQIENINLIIRVINRKIEQGAKIIILY